MATPKKVAPRVAFGDVKPVADDKTLEALIANRYELMAGYARDVRKTCADELHALRARQSDVALLEQARRWLHRDDEKVPANVKPAIEAARMASPVIDKMITMRAELQALWLSRTATREQMQADLQAWCKRAEDSGIAALQAFSMRLRAARV
jgi:stearoyl-CoA desaturase (delta-9 desaturase)